MVSDIIERIRAYLRQPGVTKKGLADLAGLHPNTLQGVERDGWNPTAATLRAIEVHLPSGNVGFDGQHNPVGDSPVAERAAPDISTDRVGQPVERAA